MSIPDLDEFEGSGQPEIFIGLVAAVGAPLNFFMTSILEPFFEDRGYQVETIHVSDFLRDPKGLKLTPEYPDSLVDQYTRISSLMSRGDELRRVTRGGEALALFTVAHINSQRPDQPPLRLPGRVWILNQLKHPDEVEWLRRIYRPGFHLIGLYCPRGNRQRHLEVLGPMTSERATHLIERDAEEPVDWGQKLSDTYHLADVFVEMRDVSVGEADQAKVQLERFGRLLLGEEILTPTIEEYGMNLAMAAALRSADLSRQVGAAILTPQGEVLSVGVNDVPCYGGGLYWSGERDARDMKIGYDSNEKMKRQCLEEILSRTHEGWQELTGGDRDQAIDKFAKKLSGTRVVNLTEFGRAVHAEMEAITAAARVGVSIRGSTLFSTTFPCHNCTKHIIASGIERVVYVEPYPKSLAHRLHKDAVSFDEDEEESGARKVQFEPFVGVAPRSYADLFSAVSREGRRFKRKDEAGNVLTKPLGLRMKASPFSYIERESIAAKALEQTIEELDDQLGLL